MFLKYLDRNMYSLDIFRNKLLQVNMTNIKVILTERLGGSVG